MKIFSVGIVGAGIISRDMHLPVLLSMPNVRVEWLADLDAGRAQRMARAYGVPRAVTATDPADLPESEIVLLAIPLGARAPYYRPLALRSAAVFVEKPFAASLREHREIVALFPEPKLACGYMRRTYDSIAQLRRAVAQGWYGQPKRIRVAEGARNTRSGADQMHYDQPGASGGGALITQGSHSLDAVLHLTQAHEFKVLEKNLQWDGQIDRKVEAQILLSGGSASERWSCSVEFCVSWLDRQDNLLEIEFERARLSSGLTAEAGLILHDADGRKRAILGGLEPGAKTSNQAFYLEWRDFLRGLAESRPSIISAASAQLTTALVEELYRPETT
jgi:predicted dehydrogenase